jgi:hypothetical protein
MPHVFAQQPDGRQSADVEHRVSRFRPSYRALTEEEKGIHDAIKQEAQLLEVLYETLPDGRYKSLAMTALEESVMWIIKELTSNRS